MPAYLTR